MEANRITVDTILEKKFSCAAKGFSPQEVDEFLDLICDELDRREAESNELRKALEKSNAAQPKTENVVLEKARPATNFVDDSFREILEMAKRVKDQTIADAQTKAKEILANAEDEARKQLGELTAQKTALEQELAEMKLAAKAYYEQTQDAMNRLNKLL